MLLFLLLLLPRTMQIQSVCIINRVVRYNEELEIPLEMSYPFLVQTRQNVADFYSPKKNYEQLWY